MTLQDKYAKKTKRWDELTDAIAYELYESKAEKWEIFKEAARTYWWIDRFGKHLVNKGGIRR